MDPALIFLLAFAIGTAVSLFLTHYVIEIKIVPTTSSSSSSSSFTRSTTTIPAASAAAGSAVTDASAVDPTLDDTTSTSTATTLWMMVGVVIVVVLVAVLMFLLIRTICILYTIRKIRQMPNPIAFPSSSSSSSSSTNDDDYDANSRRTQQQQRQRQPVKTLVVLGSGGHTTEMLQLIKGLDSKRYTSFVLVVATTDTTSLDRVRAFSHPLPIAMSSDDNSSNINSNGNSVVYRIPRSREVGQSYLSSVVTTLYSFGFALQMVAWERPDLVLVNGPGTCLPVAVSAFFFRIVGWKPSCRLVFVESFCRVTSLSLTGKLLYPIADLFLVCWEQLQELYPQTHLVTTFVPRSNEKSNEKKKKVQ